MLGCLLFKKKFKNKWNVILDQKLYDNTNQGIISDTSKFKKLDQDSTLKSEALLQCFYISSNKKNFFN